MVERFQTQSSVIGMAYRKQLKVAVMEVMSVFARVADVRLAPFPGSIGGASDHSEQISREVLGILKGNSFEPDLAAGWGGQTAGWELPVARVMKEGRRPVPYGS
jgi:hypothetical protein